MPTQLSPQQIDQFNRNGFLNAGPVLTAADVDELTRELDRVIAKGPEGFSSDEPKPVLFRNIGGNATTPVWQIVNIWETSSAFERLIYHPFVVNAICQLTGFGDLMVWHDQVQYKPASHGGATGWHQDAPLWPIIKPMTPVSAWIPFDDAEVDNGCMWMVPGSHEWGNQIQYLGTQSHLKSLDEFKNLTGFSPPADASIKTIQAVPCPVKRGEVHFHHSLTWHGSPQNKSTRPRRALAIHYMTSDARFVAGGEHVMKQFVDMPDNAPMAEAGPHFPTVCRSGIPVGEPPKHGPLPPPVQMPSEQARLRY